MGYGDDLMVTGEAEALKKANPDLQILIGNGEREFFSPLFTGNPNITRLRAFNPSAPFYWLHNYPGHRPYIDYKKTPPDLGKQVFFKPYRAKRGKIYLSTEERALAKAHTEKFEGSSKPLVLIEPCVEFGPNKDWGFEKWQKIVTSLCEKFNFIQPHYPTSRPLNKVSQIKTASFREACALLERSSFYLGPEGGLHHAAAALNKPAVVIFGGRTSPVITGYEGHFNFYVEDDLSPCGMVAPCAHCKECMDQISVESVLSCIRNNFIGSPA